MEENASKGSFSINKYGDRQAYNLAVKARRQALREMAKRAAG